MTACRLVTHVVLPAAAFSALVSSSGVGGPASQSVVRADDGELMTRPMDPYARAKVVWEKMALVRPGMTKRAVEAILGPPDTDMDAFGTNDSKFGWGRTYYSAWKPGMLCPSRWCANYDTSGPEPVLYSIGGPIHPSRADLTPEQWHEILLERDCIQLLKPLFSLLDPDFEGKLLTWPADR